MISPVTGTSLYVLINTTLFVSSPTKTFPVDILSSSVPVFVSCLTPFSITSTEGIYPSFTPTSVTLYLVPAGRSVKTSFSLSCNVNVVSTPDVIDTGLSFLCKLLALLFQLQAAVTKS